MIAEENEMLAIKVNIKKKAMACQTPIDASEMDIIVTNYEQMRQKMYNLEDENEKLEKQNSNLTVQLQSLKRDFDNAQ